MKLTVKGILQGVVIGLITAMIIAIASNAKNYLILGVSWAEGLVKNIWNFFISTHSILGWLLIILVILSLIGGFNIVEFFRNARAPEYYTYTKDYLYGVVWRWRWSDNRASDLIGYCPECDCRLVINDSSCRRYTFAGDPPRTDFMCEKCNLNVASIKGGDSDYARSAIEREIDRKVRTGEYKAIFSNKI